MSSVRPRFTAPLKIHTRRSSNSVVLQAVRGQHNKVSAEEAIAAIKRQGDDDADALSAQDEAVIAQLFSQRATQVGAASRLVFLCGS